MCVRTRAPGALLAAARLKAASRGGRGKKATCAAVAKCNTSRHKRDLRRRLHDEAVARAPQSTHNAHPRPGRRPTGADPNHERPFKPSPSNSLDNPKFILGIVRDHDYMPAPDSQAERFHVKCNGQLALVARRWSRTAVQPSPTSNPVFGNPNSKPPFACDVRDEGTTSFAEA